jgi:hypothetical protein
MNIYSLVSDCDHYSNLKFGNEDQDWEIVYEFNGTAIGERWKPFEVEFMKEECIEQLPQGDFPHLFAAVPVLNARAVEVLWPILEGNGELLPLRSNHGDYFIFNVTNVVDALDEETSDIVRFSDGKRILDIKRFEFRASELASVDIFKLPQDLLSSVFVTDKLMNAVTNAGLLGFDFRWLWSSSQSSTSPLIHTTELQ